MIIKDIYKHMKDLIKKLLREELLSEKLTNVESDVDTLYDRYFKTDIDEINQTGIITKDMFQEGVYSTRKLQDSESIEVNKLNPCFIKINDKTGPGNYYKPSNSEISLSINFNAVKYVLGEFNGNLKNAIDDCYTIQEKKNLKSEFSEEKIKGSIHHELAHWVDDTLHNQHIHKRLIKAKEAGTRNLGGLPINATNMEIQGQIHNIKQLHNKYKNIWDTLNFTEMLSYSPALSYINRSLTGDNRKKWVRDIKTRMYREGLLGNNMVN